MNKGRRQRRLIRKRKDGENQKGCSWFTINRDVSGETPWIPQLGGGDKSLKEVMNPGIIGRPLRMGCLGKTGGAT